MGKHFDNKDKKRLDKKGKYVDDSELEYDSEVVSDRRMSDVSVDSEEEAM